MSSSPLPNLRGHIPALDGVRGLAIVMVLAVHFIGDMRADTGFERVLIQLFQYGAMGVDLFFVLSGFLITGILYDSASKPGYFANFYMRRVLRIFPLYYAVLVVGLFVVPLFWFPPELALARSEQGWLWAYSANIFLALKGDWEALPIFNHFWSLAVEEHFYFVWPLLVFWSHGARTKHVALAIAVGAVALRIGMVLAGVNHLAVYTLTPGRLDALAMGGYMALVAREEGGLERLRRWAPRALVLAAAFIVVTFLGTRVWEAAREPFHQLRETAFSVCFCAVLILALTGPGLVRGFFGSRVMIFFGKYSYGLYVFHFLYGYFLIKYRTEDIVTRWVGSHTLAIFLQAAVATALACVVALASFHGFEKHFLKLKVRWGG